MQYLIGELLDYSWENRGGDDFVDIDLISCRINDIDRDIMSKANVILDQIIETVVHCHFQHLSIMIVLIRRYRQMQLVIGLHPPIPRIEQSGQCLEGNTENIQNEKTFKVKVTRKQVSYHFTEHLMTTQMTLKSE